MAIGWDSVNEYDVLPLPPVLPEENHSTRLLGDEYFEEMLPYALAFLHKWFTIARTNNSHSCPFSKHTKYPPLVQAIHQIRVLFIFWRGCTGLFHCAPTPTPKNEQQSSNYLRVRWSKYIQGSTAECGM